eukprot:576683-Pelagomonas_calceolata.AAC.5
MRRPGGRHAMAKVPLQPPSPEAISCCYSSCNSTHTFPSPNLQPWAPSASPYLLVSSLEDGSAVCLN